MRLLIFLAILLAFPLLELWLLFKLGALLGGWLLLYLLFIGLCGWLLIQDEKMLVFGRIVQAMQQGHPPVQARCASGRKMLAGSLLIFPGVLSDVLALILLLLPAPSPATAADDGVIEGEWRRED